MIPSRIRVSSSIIAVILGLGMFGATARAETTATEGTLVSISGTTVPAAIVLQSGTTTYTVNVTAATVLVRKFNGTSMLDEFAVGDLLQVTGSVTGTTIDATRIKNLTIQRLGAAQWGKVISIDATAKTFVLDPEHNKRLANQTVSVTASTKVFQGNRTGAFTDLSVGMTVKVIGLWRKSLNTLIADRILIKLTELNGKVSATNCSATTPTLTITRNGKQATAWTATLTANTILRDKRMLQITCADINIDDTVQIRGLLTGTNTLTALNVMDKNVARARKTWNGTVLTTDASAKTFTFKASNKSTLTTAVTSETILVNAVGKSIVFTDLAVGNKVSVYGSLNGTAVTANLVIDKSIGS